MPFNVVLDEKRRQSWHEYMQGNRAIRTEQLLIVQQDLKTAMFVLSQFETRESIIYRYFQNQFDNITALIKLRSELLNEKGKVHVKAR